ARAQVETVHLDHRPTAPRRREELEAQRPPTPRQQLDLVDRLLPLLREPADLRQLRLRLPRLRLLVAESLHEPLEPLDVLRVAVGRLLGVERASRLLAPPLVPRPAEEDRAAALELEHGRRHRLEDPAI